MNTRIPGAHFDLKARVEDAKALVISRDPRFDPTFSDLATQRLNQIEVVAEMARAKVDDAKTREMIDLVLDEMIGRVLSECGYRSTPKDKTAIPPGLLSFILAPKVRAECLCRGAKS